MRTRALVSLLAASLAAAQPAVAQAQAADPAAEAKIHYQNAETAMREGRYTGAAAEYIAAYELMKDPLLFYKIGVAYQSAKDCAKAVVYYKRYLREAKPAADMAQKVNDRVAECGSAPATGTEPAPATGTGAPAATGTGAATATEPAPPAGPPETTPPPATEEEEGAAAAAGATPTTAATPSFLDTKASWQRSTGWVLMGSTIALATAGTILAMSGASREEDLESLADFRDPESNPATYEGTVRERYEDLVDEGNRFNTWATVAFGAAGVCLAASVTLLVLDARNGHAESGSAISRGVSPVLGDHGGGVMAHFSF